MIRIRHRVGPPFRPWRAAPAVLAGLVAAAAAPAQSGYFGAADPEFRVNEYTPYDQYWVRAAASQDGTRFAFSYNSGQDVFARIFDGDGAALTPTFACNAALNAGVQDEAEIAMALDGTILTAWSDRNGYDGQLMGIFGRRFTSAGAPLGPEFQINAAWQASQWRPLIEARPAGGWIVSWSGEWDGDAFFRVLDGSGAFLTGDVRVNTFQNGGQADSAHAIAPGGAMLAVFVDYSGYGGIGSGTNLWGRLFDQHGSPLQAQESPLNTPGYTSADQREPRVAADGLSRFIVVWEDAQKDGAGWGVFGRRFDAQGLPLGPEFLIPTSTAGNQRNPRVAADASGRFVVVWDDASSGGVDIRAQRFDAQGAPLGAELVVHESTAGDQRRPSLALSAQGEEVVFCFESPTNSTDVYARIFSTYQKPDAYCTAKLNSLGCAPAMSSSGAPSLSGADDFVLRASPVINNKNGIFFYGFAPSSAPFLGGTLCVQPPLVRTPVQGSGGNPPPDDCSGALQHPFSHAEMLSQGLSAGTLVYAQAWSRDPRFAPPDAVSLSDGLVFEVRP